MSVELLPFDPARDRELVARWLAKAHVAEWWGDPAAQLEAVLSRPEGGEDALVAVAGTPVGYVRWQVVPRGELDAAGLAEVPEGAVDIDIAIGEERCVGRGVGPAALALAVERIESSCRPPMIVMGTAVANVRALRAFAKAGFLPLRELEDPEYGRYWLLRYSPPAGGPPGSRTEGRQGPPRRGR